MFRIFLHRFGFLLTLSGAATLLAAEPTESSDHREYLVDVDVNDLGPSDVATVQFSQQPDTDRTRSPDSRSSLNARSTDTPDPVVTMPLGSSALGDLRVPPSTRIPSAPRSTVNPPLPVRSPRRSTRRSFSRLARAPDMFGDVFGSLTIEADTGADFVTGDLPLAGGSRRVKIAEHNRALPTDRVYLLYNHFHNALRYDRSPAMGLPVVVSTRQHVDQITIGGERTFDCGNWSIEARLPFIADAGIVSASPGAPATPDFVLSGGNVGNLSLIFKRLFYKSENYALATGLGLNLPTGSNVSGALPLAVPSVEFQVRNDAVHLSPFVALTASPSVDSFVHAFAQIDTPINDYSVDAVDSGGGTASGNVSDQSLLYVSMGGGYWLLRRPGCTHWTGVAAMLEFHYTTALEDPDSLSLLTGMLRFGNTAGRFGVVNVTAGIHTEVTALTSLRFAGVFPVNDGDDRFFDAEVQGSLIRRF